MPSNSRWMPLLGLLILPLLAADEPPRADLLLNHIKVLASDAFEGRAPGTPGEEKTVAYLTEQFRSLGLAPGNPDGTFLQKVPLAGFQTTSATGTLKIAGSSIDLTFPDRWVAVSRRQAERVEVANSEVVFVGYGVVAPEFGWDDYKGLDVKGKTLVMLVGDPPVPDPNDSSKLDESIFRGRAMTYYGRWTYKYEIATEKGASAVLLVHETGPAGYPYSVVQGSWGRENFDISSPGAPIDRVAIESWISLETAQALFKAAGLDFDGLKSAAVRRDFQPRPLGGRADLKVTSRLRTVESQNVVARLEGQDPKLKNEFLIFTAHWDHLGRDESLKGDQVFNGAADNASGTAALLELARVCASAKPGFRRTLVFLSVTAEEKGLLGAKYYATHPLYPLEKTLVNLNMDVLNLWGRTRDLSNLGLGQTTLDGVIDAAAKPQGRRVVGDAEPEKGLFYRSDHFEFVRQGVPAVNVRGGMDFVDRPADYGPAKRAEYTKNDYHKVTDEVKPDWDLSGAVEDLNLLLTIARSVDQADRYPEWRPGTEFKARRDAMLAPRTNAATSTSPARP